MDATTVDTSTMVAIVGVFVGAAAIFAVLYALVQGRLQEHTLLTGFITFIAFLLITFPFWQSLFSGWSQQGRRQAQTSAFQNDLDVMVQEAMTNIDARLEALNSARLAAENERQRSQEQVAMLKTAVNYARTELIKARGEIIELASVVNEARGLRREVRATTYAQRDPYAYQGGNYSETYREPVQEDTAAFGVGIGGKGAVEDLMEVRELKAVRDLMEVRDMMIEEDNVVIEEPVDVAHVVRENPEALRLKAMRLAEMGRLNDAVRTATRAIELAPEEAETFYVRGYSHNAMERYPEAIEDFTRAIQLDPSSVKTYISRAETYDRMKEFERALHDLNKAVRLDLANPSVYNTRGLVYGHLKKFDKAVDSFTKAIRLDMNYAEAYHNRAVTFQRLGENEKAWSDRLRYEELTEAKAQKLAMQSVQ